MWRLGVLQSALIALVLCACATRYQEMGLTGGVTSQQMSGDTFRIISRGNGFTTAERVQDYTLLKAAEVTQSVGATHFMVVGAADATRVGVIQTPATAQTHWQRCIHNGFSRQHDPNHQARRGRIHSRFQFACGTAFAAGHLFCS
jgi:hypothetical protein